MESILNTFQRATARGQENGNLLAFTLTPEATAENPLWLEDIAKSSNESKILHDVRYATIYNSSLSLPKAQAQAWLDIYIAFWHTVKKLVLARNSPVQDDGTGVKWKEVYQSWKILVDAIVLAYSKDLFETWTIPCLYVAGKYLRVFAIKADTESAHAKADLNFDGLEDDAVGDVESQKNLEDAASLLMRMFSLCSNDRAPIENSRKWGMYNTANLLLKTYFKLDKLNLTKSILRPFNTASADMPPLEAFPKSHAVTFKYYIGIISFMEENYALANEHLSYAYRLCPKSSSKHRQLILTYLIPCHLHLNRTLPSAQLLAPFPYLQGLFAPLCAAIKQGDLAGFDAALDKGQDEFIRRRIYLTLERGREVCLRNVFRKVFLAAGYEETTDQSESKRRTRIKVDEFWAGLKLSMGEAEAVELDRDEVECLIANCVYKGLMKGYISRQHGMVVLSKGGAFPNTGV